MFSVICDKRIITCLSSIFSMSERASLQIKSYKYISYKSYKYEYERYFHSVKSKYATL